MIIIFNRGSLKRRRPDLNRRVLVLQTIALPLGYYAELFAYYILSNTGFYVKSFIGAILIHMQKTSSIEPNFFKDIFLFVSKF